MRLALPLLSALVFTSCATVPADEAQGIQGASYVAMGSSFAAGAGIGPRQEGSPERCNRTVKNYASLLAAHLSLDLDDQSCGGATTTHLLEAWNELPAQIDAVSADTRLVTITVGGNDLNYMGLLFTASCDPDVGMMFNSERQECPPRVHLPSEDAYAGVQASLEQVARSVRERAPHARIVFVQYVSLVPEELCASTPLDTRAQAEARELASRLASVTRAAAKTTGAMVLDLDQLSQQHTPCDPESWSRGFAAGYDGSEGAPWHPTALGHAEIADLLATLLANSSDS